MVQPVFNIFYTFICFNSPLTLRCFVLYAVIRYEDEDMELEDVLAEDHWVDPEDEEETPNPKKLSKKAIKEREAKDAEVKAKNTKALNANRQYFHSRTFLPMDNPMSDDDSEVETNDFDIMFEARNKLLHEFDDVNDGEKWMMKLWNEFVMQR